MTNESDSGLTGLLPVSVDGWQKTEDQIYDRGNLYNYIDGGAELYLSYGFQRVLNRTYIRTGQPKIVVDLFDMQRSANAFGVFSHTRETVDTTFGQGSQYYPGLLTFWKDHYYVSILASPETPESKQAIENLARIIEKSIPETGQLPEILNYLPRKNLRQESIRYFTHSNWLNSHFFIADQNIFQISEDAPAVLAKYPGQGILLLVRYPEPWQADAAFQEFKKYFTSQSNNQGKVHDVPVNHPEGEAPVVNFLMGIKIIQLEDGSWAGAQLYDRQFAAVFQGNGDEEVTSLLGEVQEIIRK